MEDVIAIFTLNFFAPVAEKFNGATGQGFAVDRVRHVIEHLVVERFFYDRGVAYPDDNSGGIAVLHISKQQVSSGLFKDFGELDSNTPVPVPFIRVQFEVPVRHFRIDVSGLIVMHQAPADVVDLHFVPVQTQRIGADVGFDIFKQEIHPDTVRFKIYQDTVAVAILHGRHVTGGLGTRRFKNAPVRHDLIDVLPSPVCIILLVYFPVIHGPVVLPAVFIDLGQHCGGVVCIAFVGVTDNFLQQFDMVILPREVEALHAVCQPGKGFVIR